MRSTGVVRRTDQLGRITVPKEIRKEQGIDYKTPMEIFVSDDGAIVLKKYEPFCIFCGSAEGIEIFKGKKVCGECRQSLIGG